MYLLCSLLLFCLCHGSVTPDDYVSSLSHQQCEVPDRKGSSIKGDLTCQRILGPMANMTILHDRAVREKFKISDHLPALNDFYSTAEQLLKVAANTCDLGLKQCVVDLLVYGCSLKYFVCIPFGTKIGTKNKQAYKLSQACMGFCNEAVQCANRYPETKAIIDDLAKGSKKVVTGEDFLKSASQDICLVKPKAKEGAKVDAKDFCRYVDSNGATERSSMPSLERLYKDWGLKDEAVCCNKNNKFLKLPQGQNCVMKCSEDVMYKKDEKVLAYNWLLVWSTLCAVTSTFTVFTYITDVSRFLYPERPIIFHSFCCLLYSVGHIIRLANGREGVACIDIYNEKVYLQEGLDGGFICTFSFLIAYYAQIALHVWWVFLAFSWYLTAAKGWSQESLESISIWFHLIAWTIPTVQTVIILVTKRFEGDPLTGMCVVGAQTPMNSLAFIIVPISVYIILGVFFIARGFVSMIKFRKHIRNLPTTQPANEERRFDKMMIRMAVFTVTYAIPSILFILLSVYEFTQMPKWQRNALLATKEPNDAPKVDLILVRMFLTFALGIGSSFWIVNVKTLRRWVNVMCRCSRSHVGQKTTFKEVPNTYAPVVRIPTVASPAGNQKSISMNTNMQQTSRNHSKSSSTEYDMGKV